MVTNQIYKRGKKLHNYKHMPPKQYIIGHAHSCVFITWLLQYVNSAMQTGQTIWC